LHCDRFIQSPLFDGGEPIVPQTGLRERCDLPREFDRRRQRLTGGHQPVRKSDSERFVCAHLATGQDQIHCTAVPDQARQADGTEIDQRHPEPATENTEYRSVRYHPHVAPQCQLAAARDRIAFNGGDHRLRQTHPRRTHGPVSLNGDRPALPVRQRFQVRACAEVAAGPGQNRHIQRAVGIEASKRVR